MTAKQAKELEAYFAAQGATYPQTYIEHDDGTAWTVCATHKLAHPVDFACYGCALAEHRNTRKERENE